MSWYRLIAAACLLLSFSAGATLRFVDQNSLSPAPPFLSWATAATTIQDAVDAAVAHDEVVVTNGVYATGGKVAYGNNRVAVDKPITLRSVNGPQFTVIEGYQVPGQLNGVGAFRCVYLTNGAALSGFSLIKGATTTNADLTGGGGGVLGGYELGIGTVGTVSNCVVAFNSAGRGGGANMVARMDNCPIVSNTASGGGGYAGYFQGYYDNNENYGVLNHCTLAYNRAGGGGGAIQAILNNCPIVHNSATNDGGGGYIVGLNNCTVAANYAGFRGGGVYGWWSMTKMPCLLSNSIVYFNTAPIEENCNFFCEVSHSCTTPAVLQSYDWGGNITNEPSFANLAAGDFHLLDSSPCINAGTNEYAPGPLDLDGNPRIVGGTVDMGAYEFQSAQPALQIAPAGTNIRLAWPLWASEYQLQEIGAPSSSGGWSNVSTPPILFSNQTVVTVPLESEAKYFRLLKPQ